MSMKIRMTRSEIEPATCRLVVPQPIAPKCDPSSGTYTDKWLPKFRTSVSEMSVNICPSTQRNLQEYVGLHHHCCQTLKHHKSAVAQVRSKFSAHKRECHYQQTENGRYSAPDEPWHIVVTVSRQFLSAPKSPKRPASFRVSGQNSK